MKYRENGAIGAILDEYERALCDLKNIISSLDADTIAFIVDPDTDDDDCRSIKTVLSHVVRSGYTYAIIIRKKLGEDVEFIERELLNTSLEYCQALDSMFAFNEQLFLDYPRLTMDSFRGSDNILSNWQTRYDVDQLFEHAIVHVLRHRRQIERFILKITAD